MNRLDRMGGLHWPDPLFKPVNQGEIIGVPPEKSLAQMNMGLDKPRQKDPASAVYHFAGDLLGGAQPSNAASLDQQVTLENRILRVKCYDCGTLYEQSSVHKLSKKHAGAVVPAE